MVERQQTVEDRASAADDAPLVPSGALAADLLDRARPGRALVHVARDARRLDELAAILRAFAPDVEVVIYPEWDCLPFDRASPSRATMGQRAAVMRRLGTAAPPPDFVLTTGPALAQRVPPPETWADARVTLATGDPIDPEALAAKLVRLGYVRDERVDEPGEVTDERRYFVSEATVTATLDLALVAAGLDQVQVVHRPRLLTDNGSSYVAGDLADWLGSRGITHIRSAPRHPQTQGKIERGHLTLKNRILLEHAYLPGELEGRVAAFVEHDNHTRAHESLGNLTPADVYLGRGENILRERARIKRQTLAERRLRHHAQAA